MSVNLVIREHNIEIFKIQTHPCYYNFVNQTDFVKWQTASDHHRTEMINQLLMPYNARVTIFSVTQRIVFEFHSQEDLTQFVLTWS